LIANPGPRERKRFVGVRCRLLGDAADVRHCLIDLFNRQGLFARTLRDLLHQRTNTCSRLPLPSFERTMESPIRPVSRTACEQRWARLRTSSPPRQTLFPQHPRAPLPPPHLGPGCPLSQINSVPDLTITLSRW
jgi:hypothetical protein